MLSSRIKYTQRKRHCVTSVMMSWRNRNGGLLSNFSVRGGFFMTFPNVSCVFLAIAGFMDGPPLLLRWQNYQKLLKSGQIVKLFSNDLRPSLEQFCAVCHKDRNAMRPHRLHWLSGFPREKSRQILEKRNYKISNYKCYRQDYLPCLPSTIIQVFPRTFWRSEEIDVKRKRKPFCFFVWCVKMDCNWTSDTCSSGWQWKFPTNLLSSRLSFLPFFPGPFLIFLACLINSSRT